MNNRREYSSHFLFYREHFVQYIYIYAHNAPHIMFANGRFANGTGMVDDDSNHIAIEKLSANKKISAKKLHI